jgi:hypothetical protein
MTGLVRKATLLTFIGLLVASAALAGVPSPGNSTKPPCIRYIGTKLGAADPAGQFSVTVRDLANTVVANSNVVVDFSGCPDSHAGDQANQVFAGLTVDPTAKTVRALSNGVGVATFRIVGGVTAIRNPFAGAGCAKIYADGVLLGSVTVEAFDQDGAAGVALGDLSLWAIDYYTPLSPYFGRSDYDCSLGIGLPDLSIWATDYYSTLSAASALVYAW